MSAASYAEVLEAARRLAPKEQSQLRKQLHEDWAQQVRAASDAAHREPGLSADQILAEVRQRRGERISE